MRKVKGILFDKDGTLVSFHRFWIPFTRDLIREALHWIQGEEGLLPYLLQEMGISCKDETLIPGGFVAEKTTEELFGLLAALLQNKGLLPQERVQEFICHLYTLLTPITKRNRGNILPVTDLHQLLGSLKEADLFLGIATHDSEDSTAYFLEVLNIGQYFHFVGCAREGIPSKPHPYLLHAFSSCCHIKNQEVAVVGDTLSDLQMARNGQALAVGVLTGITDYETLQGEAHLILDSIESLYHPSAGLILNQQSFFMEQDDPGT